MITYLVWIVFVSNIIQHRVAAAYHPQTNGLTERFNQTLCDMIVKYVSEDQRGWADFINPVLFAYRTARQEAIRSDPFSLVYGYKATLAVELDMPLTSVTAPIDDADRIEARANEIQHLRGARKSALHSIGQAQVKMKSYYDSRHPPPLYKEGDTVWLKTLRRQSRKGDKLVSRWDGPKKIVKLLDKGTYRLEGMKQLLNCARLKPYVDQSPKFSVCQKEFAVSSALCFHMQCHDAVSLQCCQCSFTASCRAGLAVHLRRNHISGTYQGKRRDDGLLGHKIVGIPNVGNSCWLGASLCAF